MFAEIIKTCWDIRYECWTNHCFLLTCVPPNRGRLVFGLWKHTHEIWKFLLQTRQGGIGLTFLEKLLKAGYKILAQNVMVNGILKCVYGFQWVRRLFSTKLGESAWRIGDLGLGRWSLKLHAGKQVLTRLDTEKSTISEGKSGLSTKRRMKISKTLPHAYADLGRPSGTVRPSALSLPLARRTRSRQSFPTRVGIPAQRLHWEPLHTVDECIHGQKLTSMHLLTACVGASGDDWTIFRQLQSSCPWLKPPTALFNVVPLPFYGGDICSKCNTVNAIHFYNACKLPAHQSIINIFMRRCLRIISRALHKADATERKAGKGSATLSPPTSDEQGWLPGILPL